MHIFENPVTYENSLHIIIMLLSVYILIIDGYNQIWVHTYVASCVHIS